MSVKALLSLWVIDPEGRSYQRGAVKPIVLPILSLTCSDPINRGGKSPCNFFCWKDKEKPLSANSTMANICKTSKPCVHRSIFQNEIQNQPWRLQHGQCRNAFVPCAYKSIYLFSPSLMQTAPEQAHILFVWWVVGFISFFAFYLLMKNNPCLDFLSSVFALLRSNL